MIKEEFHQMPDEGRIGQLTDILTTSIKTGEMDERIWDYTTLRVSSSSRMRWEDEISFPLRIQQMLRRTDEQTQDHFKIAATNTLKQWDIKSDKTDQVIESLYLVAYTGAKQAIPEMINIVNNPLLNEKSEEEFFGITSLVAAMFHGFADIEGIKDDIKPALDEWLYDPRFEKLTGQFLGAINHCSPEDFAKYYQRVFDVSNEIGFFDMEWVAESVVETISEDTIKNHVQELSHDARTELQSALDSQVN